MADAIPENVRRFIADNINSVEQLEILLLLRQSSSRDWDAETVSKELCSQPSAALMRMNDLLARGFLTGGEPPGRRFRYAPARQGLDQLVEQLAEAYHTMRVSVISLIYSQPSSQVQAFADAFRFRRDV
jgi:hypothetical protein